jgi:hypothetical protein
METHTHKSAKQALTPFDYDGDIAVDGAAGEARDDALLALGRRTARNPLAV